jgi:hypothetical protein
MRVIVEGKTPHAVRDENLRGYTAGYPTSSGRLNVSTITRCIDEEVSQYTYTPL